MRDPRFQAFKLRPRGITHLAPLPFFVVIGAAGFILSSATVMSGDGVVRGLFGASSSLLLGAFGTRAFLRGVFLARRDPDTLLVVDWFETRRIPPASIKSATIDETRKQVRMQLVDGSEFRIWTFAETRIGRHYATTMCDVLTAWASDRSQVGPG